MVKVEIVSRKLMALLQKVHLYLHICKIQGPRFFLNFCAASTGTDFGVRPPQSYDGWSRALSTGHFIFCCIVST